MKTFKTRKITLALLMIALTVGLLAGCSGYNIVGTWKPVEYIEDGESYTVEEYAKKEADILAAIFPDDSDVYDDQLGFYSSPEMTFNKDGTGSFSTYSFGEIGSAAITYKNDSSTVTVKLRDFDFETTFDIESGKIINRNNGYTVVYEKK